MLPLITRSHRACCTCTHQGHDHPSHCVKPASSLIALHLGAQVEANPEGVGAALERREELLAGGSTPAAAEEAGLDADALDAAATPALESQPGDTAAAAGPPPGSVARSGFSLRPQQQQQRGPRQQPSSAAWDAFVAAQAAPQPAPQPAQQPAQQQPGVPASCLHGWFRNPGTGHAIVMLPVLLVCYSSCRLSFGPAQLR